MSEDIYQKYNIDISRLERDYIKNPLKMIPRNKKGGVKKEIPPYNDLYYLYIELNLPRTDIVKIFTCGTSILTRWCKEYNIPPKTQQHRLKNQYRTNLKKYGVENIFSNVEHLKKKRKQIYGVEYYSQTEEYNKKVKQTSLEKYGVENYAQTDECHEKMKQTCLEKYGIENYAQTEEYKQKYKNYEYVKNILEKSKQACLEKYGVEYYFQSDIYRDYENIKKIQQKIYNTKKKNNSFNISKPEDDYYKLLCEQYGEDNIIRQYKSDKYPFTCDFYNKLTDEYIEYNGMWTHGKEPYDSTNSEHQQLLQKWEEKAQTSKFYKIAIYVWTDLDVRKRNIAEKNNIKLIEVWE